MIPVFYLAGAALGLLTGAILHKVYDNKGKNNFGTNIAELEEKDHTINSEENTNENFESAGNSPVSDSVDNSDVDTGMVQEPENPTVEETSDVN